MLSRMVQNIILEISSGFTGFLSPFLWSLRNNWAVKGFPSRCLSLEQELGPGEPGLILILTAVLIALQFPFVITRSVK